LEEVRDYSAPINLERRRCNLESLVKETWQHILDAGKVDSTRKLDIVVSSDVPEESFLDPFRIQQVIRNLLENAIFACKGDTPVRINLLTTTEPPQRIRMEVVDDGEGVEEAQREKIFAPFFTTKTKGTGLGLALSRRLVQAHEGRIFVEAADSGGARFVVELPNGR
jgi:signal transduction histidine kinase